MDISQKDLDDLRRAKYLLENPGFIAKVTAVVGTPIEYGLKKLPADWQDKVMAVTHQSLEKAADGALLTLKDVPDEPASNIWHKLSVAATGAAGGFFGFAALAIELPISTAIMLRSILDIARSEGESISSAETKMECLSVFAFGSTKSNSDDDSDEGYFALRATLAGATREAISALGKSGGDAISKESSSAILKLIAIIAERFGVEVSEKIALQAIPVVGAIAGATINTLFIDHYQDMARGHFIVRRLIRAYGVEYIEQQYAALPSKPAEAPPRSTDDVTPEMA
ncbi:EcsC family protein [Dyella flava]|uniref:EcsC family protein n=1 Tax=Dyella flava TaxID=1920170 RepID=A0ABS2JYF6_9GAMM|nr:EcsC family protein [Dyella flava]MBM7124022.1 EcsC family protein [Dyella flava]GLQ50528.1 hypothetical protein GCM10010872_19770 [Dyella flava]